MCFHLQADDGLKRYAIEKRLRDSGQDAIADAFRDGAIKFLVTSDDIAKVYARHSTSWQKEAMNDALFNGWTPEPTLGQKLENGELIVQEATIPGQYYDQRLLFLTKPVSDDTNAHSETALALAGALTSVAPHEKLDLVEV